MARKKKKITAAVDYNETIVNDMKLTPEVSEDDTDFEELLNSFIASANTAPEEQPQQPDKPVRQPRQPDEPVRKPQIQEPERFEEKDEAPDENNLRQEISTLDLGVDERELALAYANFMDSVYSIAVEHQLDTPDSLFDPERMVPNYKPSVGRRITADLSECWDILLAAYPDKLSEFNPNVSDEEFLDFAERLNDQTLQLAIISYVEILIDMDNCEISYEEKRLKARRRRVERALYEEYQQRQERKQRFIEAVRSRGFPVDPDRLINNYFKTAQKDAEGAFEALTKNPAVYAPIEIEKIKPRMMGLIKASPKDGIRENKRLGEFLKKLKV